MGTATMVNGIDTTITPDTTDKEIKLLHNPVKQKLVEQMQIIKNSDLLLGRSFANLILFN